MQTRIARAWKTDPWLTGLVCLGGLWLVALVSVALCTLLDLR